MKRSINLACVLCVVASLAFADEYYLEPRVYGMRPSPRNEWNMGPIGPTGIFARIYKGMRIKVEKIEPGSPAAGKLKKGDLLLGVNGIAHKGKNPLPVFGAAITEAEAKDGILTFDIQEKEGGETKQVTITIPLLGAYSETYPLNCKKSEAIVKQAAEFYSSEDRLQRYDLWSGLACLFLLSTGDEQYIPRVKTYFSKFLNEDGMVQGLADHSWWNGFNGIAVGEYYLRTGDKSVLPILQHYCDDAKRRQKYGIGWSHWGLSVFSSYESGGGVMHGAGNQILTTLLMGKLCGVNVDYKALLGALKHWYRFVGHGAIPASDQRPYHIFRSAGRDGATACLMQIASMAQGDTTIYRNARDYLGFSALTSWPERTWEWETYWHNLGGQFVRDIRPDMYQQTMDRFKWRYDLSRSASGGLYWPERVRTEHSRAGISMALAYTAPLKTLQITGAPRSKYAKEFTLPERLWGNEADLAFLSSKNHPDFSKFGDEDEIHIPYWQIKTTKLSYKPEELKGVPLNVLQKNVRHWRYAMREAAAKGLCFNGHYDEIERLLVDKDPRLRRAALDGINDARHWFLDSIVSKNALKPEQYTSGMIKAIEAMLANPDESWYVIDGALNAMSHAPIKVIERNIPQITPWLTSEEWWLRHSAFNALMGLKKNEKLFVVQLPVIIDTMVKEYHWNPRHKMVLDLKSAMETYGNDSEVGKLIIAGLTRATLESEVKPQIGDYPRQDEGITNILEAAHIAMKAAPESAFTIGREMAQSGRLKEMNTADLIKLVKSNDGYLKDRFLGMIPALDKLPEKDRAALKSLILNTYRPELIKRCSILDNSEGKGRKDRMLGMAMLNLLSDLAELKDGVKGWQILGKTEPAERMWRYHSFDVVKKSEKRSPRVGHRLRDVTLPKGMETWFMPEFDDSKWTSGKTPIGIGDFKTHGHGYLYTSNPRDFTFQSNSDWGEKEFILARTTFMVEDTDFDYFRLKVLAEGGFHLWINGQHILGNGRGEEYPTYRSIILNKEKMTQYLKKGKNSIAVYGVVRYEQDKKGDDFHPVGQLDLWIEGLKKKDIGLVE